MPNDRRLVLVLLAVGLVGLVLAGRLLRTPAPAGGEPLPAPLVTASAPGDAAEPPAGPVLVHVVGAVRRPGVYRLRGGSRVRDAVRAAGGARAGAQLAGLNLASRLADGEQVVLPGRGVPASAVAGDAAAGGHGGGIVHLNSATVEQLDGLDGIGPALAARIVDYRGQHGGFRSVEQLGEVAGIGPTRLEALHGHVVP